MLIILLILIFARPFISSLAFPYANYFYSILLAAFLAGWVIFKKSSLRNAKSVAYPLFFFSLALIISAAFSQNRLNSLSELYKYVTGMLLLIVGATLKGKDRKQTIDIIVCSGVIIALLAIYQYFFGFRHVSDYMARHNITSDFTLDYIQRKRVFFPFVTPNILAGYLAMIIPLSLIYKYRVFILTPLFMALLLTKSLGGLLCLLLASTLYFFLSKEKDWKKISIFLCGLLMFASIIFLLRIVNAQGHTHPFYSTTMRLDYWRQALEIIKAHPLQGLGLGNFNLPLSRYAHNSYLQIWAETGILGIASFLWLIFVIFKGAILRLNNSSGIKQNAALLAACAVFLAHNFFDFSFFLPETVLIWWLISGLLITKE